LSAPLVRALVLATPVLSGGAISLYEVILRFDSPPADTYAALFALLAQRPRSSAFAPLEWLLLLAIRRPPPVVPHSPESRLLADWVSQGGRRRVANVVLHLFKHVTNATARAALPLLLQFSRVFEAAAPGMAALAALPVFRETTFCALVLIFACELAPGIPPELLRVAYGASLRVLACVVRADWPGRALPPFSMDFVAARLPPFLAQWQQTIPRVPPDCQVLGLKHLRFLMYAFAPVVDICLAWIERRAIAQLAPAAAVRREFAKLATETIRERFSDTGPEVVDFVRLEGAFRCGFEDALRSDDIEFAAIRPWVELAVAVLRCPRGEWRGSNAVFRIIGRVRGAAAHPIVRTLFEVIAKDAPQCCNPREVAVFIGNAQIGEKGRSRTSHSHRPRAAVRRRRKERRTQNSNARRGGRI
jgi:hypothetical protein